MKFHLLFISLLLCLLLAVPALAVPSYEVTVWDCDPPNLDVHAIRVVGRGVLVNISGMNSEDDDHSFTVHFFLTDSTSAHNLIAYGTRQITNSSTVYVLGTDFIDWNNSYFLWMGVKIGSTYTRDNCFFFTDDGSVMTANFTGEGTDLNDNFALGDGYADDYIGAYIYFEPGFYDSYVDVSIPGVTNFGQMVIDYGESVGMPWFYLVIAFLITAIVVCIPLSFSLKYHFDMPNFIYGILVIAGVSLNFALGLLYLWMFAVFILVTVFILTIRFKDQLQSLMPWRAPGKSEKVDLSKASLEPYGTEKTKKYPFKQARLPVKTDVGIAPQRVKKPVKQTVQMPLIRPPLESEVYKAKVTQLELKPPKRPAMWSVLRDKQLVINDKRLSVGGSSHPTTAGKPIKYYKGKKEKGYWGFAPAKKSDKRAWKGGN